MREINKIINIILIFMIMGVFLSPGKGYSLSDTAALRVPSIFQGSARKRIANIASILPKGEVLDFALELSTLFNKKINANGQAEKDGYSKLLRDEISANRGLSIEIVRIYQEYRKLNEDAKFCFEPEKLIEFIQSMPGLIERVSVAEVPSKISPGNLPVGVQVKRETDKLSIKQIEKLAIKSAFSRISEWKALNDWEGVFLAMWVIEQIDPKNNKFLRTKRVISKKIDEKILLTSQNKDTVSGEKAQKLILGYLRKLNPYEPIDRPEPLLKELFCLRKHINIEKAHENSARCEMAYYNASTRYDDRVQWLSSLVLSFIAKENHIIPISSRKNIEVKFAISNVRTQRRKLSDNI